MPASSARAARNGDKATAMPSSSSSARQSAPKRQRPRPTSKSLRMTIPDVRQATPRLPPGFPPTHLASQILSKPDERRQFTREIPRFWSSPVAA